jgi:hypothetical protein
METSCVFYVSKIRRLQWDVKGKIEARRSLNLIGEFVASIRIRINSGGGGGVISHIIVTIPLILTFHVERRLEKGWLKDQLATNG